MANEVKITAAPFSWMRFGVLKQVDVLSGQDLLTPMTYTWYGLFQEPDLANRTGDIEYTLVDGDRLDKLAQAYYGTMALWWVIAARNNLDLPDIQIYGGVKVIIPDPAYVTATFGSKRIEVER